MKNLGKRYWGIFFIVLPLILIIDSLSFGFLIPLGPPDPTTYNGGEASFTIDPPATEGGSASWTNGTGQSIHDVWIKCKKVGGSLGTDHWNADIRVNDVAQNWTRSATNSQGEAKYVTENPSGACPPNSAITVGVSPSGKPGPKFKEVFVHFTDSSLRRISIGKVVDNTNVTSGGMDIITIDADGELSDDDWSILLTNGSDYLITGFTFSEYPSLTMTDLDISIPGTTNITTGKVTFDYPLTAGSGKVVVSAEYSNYITVDTTVSCDISVSEVIPVSANPRQTFTSGTNKSVPDITLSEVVCGAINEESGYNKIILEPRERFEFNSVSSLSIPEGNIQLGTPYISNGKIYIPIIAPSYNETPSTIELCGITINTLEGLSEGAVSLRQTEPTGNNSNFYYAFFDDEE